MKPHNKLTQELLHHRTHWISILTPETPFPKLYTQIKHVKYESGLHCIRFIQLCLKAGHADEGEAAIQYYKLNFKTSASAGLNALFLAVCQWYDFFIYHSERVDNLESEFLETVTGNHAIETKYIGYYTLGFYHLARSEFDTAKCSALYYQV